MKQRLFHEIPDPFIGQQLKTYLIVRSLGKGFFGNVYLVDDQAKNEKLFILINYFFFRYFVLLFIFINIFFKVKQKP